MLAQPVGERLPSKVPSTTNAVWAEVYDELRSHQCLASVINDPNRGNRLIRGEVSGLEDFWDAVCESVEELGGQQQNEADTGLDPATVARIDALIGPVPEASECQPYLDSFKETWDSYYKSHRGKVGGKPGGQKGAADGDDTSLAHRSVPPEYFQIDFKLEHHLIFKQALQTSVERQEELNAELTGHLDMIEVSLLEHIRRAQRDKVFDSLAGQSEPLQQDLKATLASVGWLRGQLRFVQRTQLHNALAVGRLARRKRRMAEVLQRLDCLAHVQQSAPSIHMLLQGKDYVTALDLLESTNSALETSLKSLSSVKPSATKLAQLGNTFDRSVELDFVHHSTEAIFGPSGGTAGVASLTKGSLAAGSPAIAAAAGGMDARGAERLKSLCACLARREQLRTTVSSTLRDILLSHLKKVVKTQARSLLEELATPLREEETTTAASGIEDGSNAAAVGAAAVEDGAPGTEASKAADGAATAGMSAALSSLSFENFLLFWKQLLEECINIARRFFTYASLVHSSSSAQAASNESDCAAELLRLYEVVMTSLLQKSGVLLQARQAEHRALRAADWKLLISFTHNALDQIKTLHESCKQQLCPKDAFAGADVRVGMRTVLYGQTKTIIEDFHTKHMARIAETVDQERWERADVPTPYKQLLDRLMGQSQQAEALAEPQGVESYLQVEGVRFFAVPAVLELIKVLNEYVDLCRDFTAVAAEVVQRMCALLKLFNQKSYEAILRGQSVQRQTLKKITASNIALCSQCCGLVAQFLPSLQARIVTVVQDPQVSGAAGIAKHAVTMLAGDLSKVATEYSDHRAALFSKLSDLLTQRYEEHSKKWLSTPHSEATGDPKPHEALEGLVKDVTSMYRVLLKNLNADTVRKIFAKAFEDIATKFEQRLGQELPAPSPPYQDREGQSLGDRLALDIAYLQEQLDKLSGISTPLRSFLSNLVQHLQKSLPGDDPLKALRPSRLDALRKAGQLPQ